MESRHNNSNSFEVYEFKPDTMALGVDWLKNSDSKILAQYENIVLARSNISARNPWALDQWHNARFAPVESITKAADLLRSYANYWTMVPVSCHRRAALIAEKAGVRTPKKRTFPFVMKEGGKFALTGSDQMIVSKQTTSRFVGDPLFSEDKVNPPSRAYLKLYEALAHVESLPDTRSMCIDFGAAPGGWTWVLHQLGAIIESWDRADLDPKLMSAQNITHNNGDVFKQTPDKYDRVVDWIVSDIVAYPEKQFDFIRNWIESGKVNNVIATLKFQAGTDYQTIELASQIPGSKVIHLWHNKHEVTWFWSRLND